MIPVPGQRVGPYEIRGRLGSGGMGLVFSAWDSRLHRDVAIKLLRDEFSILDSRQRFLTEARAASGLNHPNICTVFDIGEYARSPFLVMELLTGQTLSQRLSRGHLSAAGVLTLGREIAGALAAAHARSILHRDIKPANIFLVDPSPGGWKTKVLDFGLAKVENIPDHAAARSQFTAGVAASGTAAYMSPEQARGETVDARSDLFALGIVLFESAAGRLPFGGRAGASNATRPLDDPAPAMQALTPRLPRDLERIILKLLIRDRAGRYQSANDVLEDLQNVDLKRSPMDPFRWLMKEPSYDPLPVVEPTRITDPEWLLPESPGPASPARATSESLPTPDLSLQQSAFPVDKALAPTASSEAVHFTHKDESEPLPPLSELAFPPAETNFLSAAALEKEPAFDLPMVPLDPAPNPILSRRLSASRWAAAALCIALALIAALRRPSPVMSATGAPQLLLATAIVNDTGESALNDITVAALGFTLEQSPRLGVLGPNPADAKKYPVRSPADGATLARSTAASSFLYGRLTHQAGVYLLKVGIYGVQNQALLFEVRETASTRQELIPALDRLSSRIRLGLGETSDSVARSSVPLAREATANLAALHAYQAGASAEAANHPLKAIEALQQAVSLDPQFTQAWLRLADLYREAHAEVAAADAATHARDSSAGASDHTRLNAQASYELNATGDYPHALSLVDDIAARFPRDPQVGAKRALLLRLQGRFTDSLQAARSTLDRNPADHAALRQGAYALLAIDRKDAVKRLETDRSTQPDASLRVLLSALDSSPNPLPDVPSDNLHAQMIRAQALDASGQFTSGLAAWKAAVDAASVDPALASAAASMLAQAAVNRALTSDCVSARDLATQAAASTPGPAALFNFGIVQGLCGNIAGTHEVKLALMSKYPQSFAVKKYYLANLTALDQIIAGDTDAALDTLQPAASFDLVSWTPLLRAAARSTSAHHADALNDLEAIQQHPGAAMLFSPLLSVLAQLNIARAYASEGDHGNSVLAYRKFENLWKSADPSHPLVMEARKHAEPVPFTPARSASPAKPR